MVQEAAFLDAIQALVKEDFAEIQIGESLIQLVSLDGSTRLSLKTNVYQGENYLPQSVRAAMDHKFPQARKIRTSLSLEEQTFNIYLNYLGGLEGISKRDFRSLLTEFAIIADEWRQWFDEHDFKDRIHVKKK